MPQVDYHAITQKIREILAAAPALAGVTVTAERDVAAGFERKFPWVNVRIASRTPVEGQPIAAGKATRYHVEWVVECWAWHADGLDASAKQRDTLIGHVERALMDNRNLGGLVTGSWLAGGEFRAAAFESDWVLEGEVRLVADVLAEV
jgi:hypothetical protein